MIEPPSHRPMVNNAASPHWALKGTTLICLHFQLDASNGSSSALLKFALGHCAAGEIDNQLTVIS